MERRLMGRLSILLAFLRYTIECSVGAVGDTARYRKEIKGVQKFFLRALTVATIVLCVAMSFAGAAPALQAHPLAPGNGAATVSSTPAAPYPLFWFSPPLATRFLPPYDMTAVAFDPATPGTALASTYRPDDVILRTTDHGLTWSPLSAWSGVPGSYFHVSYGEQPGVYYAWSGYSVHVTTTSGNAWTELALDPTDPERLIVFHYNGISVGLPARGRAMLPLMARPWQGASRRDFRSTE
jgi:hypothetical protein